MHQIDRINAYAEYAIYTSIDRDYFEKKYSVDRQKKNIYCFFKTAYFRRRKV